MITKIHVLLRPIDSISLLDKVILHKLTHTRNGRNNLDVDAIGSLEGWAVVKYGWHRCRELAQEGSSDKKREAQRNADSIALCGSGESRSSLYLLVGFQGVDKSMAIRFINQGLVVSENGKVKHR